MPESSAARGLWSGDTQAGPCELLRPDCRSSGGHTGARRSPSHCDKSVDAPSILLDRFLACLVQSDDTITEEAPESERRSGAQSREFRSPRLLETG